MKFILPFPPSVNSAYNMRGKKRVKSKKDKDWELIATDAINKQGILPFSGRAVIIYHLNHPDNRIRDCANYEKKVTDLLVYLNILQGDDRRYVKTSIQTWTDRPGKDFVVEIIPAADFLFP